VIAPIPGDGYPAFSGTSFASAHASGAAALLLELAEDVGPSELRGALEGGALDLGPSGRDRLYGHGRIDVCEAARQLTLDERTCEDESAGTSPTPPVAAPAPVSVAPPDPQRSGP